MNDDESRSIDLQIDELVLNGFAAADGQAIGDAVQRELARLLVEQGVPSALTRNVEFETLTASANDVRSGANADTTGASLAQAIYRGCEK